MKPIRELTPGGPVYAEDYNELAAEVVRQGKLIGDGVEVEELAGGRTLRVPAAAVRFRARVWADDSQTGSGQESGSGAGFCPGRTAYNWQQTRPTACGGREDDPNGISGSVADRNPAFEANGGTVADNADVELTTGLAYVEDGRVVQEWLFDGSPAAGLGSAGGFFAWLTGQPGDNPLGSGGSGGCTGTSADGPSEEDYNLWNPLGQVLPAGYAWVEIAVASPGLAAGAYSENGWDIKTDGRGNTNVGTTCYRQAYHSYGRADIPLTQSDHSKTVVFLRPTPRMPGESPAKPTTYVFEYLTPPATADGGSGCGIGGTNASSLFQNCQTLDGCWGVEIDGIFYPITVKDASGNVIAGGG